MTPTMDQIAAQLQGYDPQSLRADAVGQFLEKLVEPVTNVEQVSVFDALDRILAQDIVSPISGRIMTGRGKLATFVSLAAKSERADRNESRPTRKLLTVGQSLY